MSINNIDSLFIDEMSYHIINQVTSKVITRKIFLTKEELKNYVDDSDIMLNTTNESDFYRKKSTYLHNVTTIIGKKNNGEKNNEYFIVQLVAKFHPLEDRIWTVCRCAKEELVEMVQHMKENRVLSSRMSNGNLLGWAEVFKRLEI